MQIMSKFCSFLFRETLLSSILLLVFILPLYIYNYCSHYCYISSLQAQEKFYSSSKTIPLAHKRRDPKKLPFAIGDNGGCNLFTGTWVRDYTRPLYNEWECPYIKPQLTCHANGRTEMDYLFWRWQPHACSVPRFNATFMLEALRGKRLMFVGDSLNRGQFTSLVCLLQSAIPDQHAKTMEEVGSFEIFTAKDYNARIEFYWAPFLLESNADNPVKHRVSDRIIKKGTVDKHGQHWKEADILVFNTYIWWINGLSVLQGSFDHEVKNIKKVPMDDAYRIAMKSLVKWVDNNVDPTRTRLFFSTLSPTHQWSYKWRQGSNGNCYNETTMIQDPNYFGAEKSLMHILTQELNKSTVPITVMNITHLSSCRKDAHVSIHKKQWGKLSEQQPADPKNYADCIHWCLPGLQDVWNELLFSKLFYP